MGNYGRLLRQTFSELRSRWFERPLKFDAAALDAARVGEGLPKGFLLGAATAAHQIEGGNENDWTDWERGAFQDGTPHIKRGEVSGPAVDGWNRFDEDLRLLQELGATGYRFSVEWSRLEPASDRWDEAAAARYRGWAVRLREAGIEPMVTLCHFTLPRWVAAAGGWEREETVERFAAFSGRVGKLLGDAVDLWCTVNEPNVHAYFAFDQGAWPPGRKDPKLAVEVLGRLLRAHGRATEALRAADTVDADGDGRAVLSSVAHHVRPLRPATRSPLDCAMAAASNDFFNESTVRALVTGRYQVLVPGVVDVDEELPAVKGSCDYLGINYYTRDHIAANLAAIAKPRLFTPETAQVSDVHWELYPEGLYQTLVRYGRSTGLPLVVTENGIADGRGGGARRGDFLRAHLHAVERAVAEGADVRGYFHWALVDNFEWAEGWEPRFGLYSVDRGTMARSATSGAAAFRQAADSLRRARGTLGSAVTAGERRSA